MPEEKLTLNDVIEHLKKFSPARCEFCGSTNWVVYTDRGGIATVLESSIRTKTNDGISLSIGGGVPVIQVQCQNCGQVKYFGLQAILESVRKDEAHHDNKS